MAKVRLVMTKKMTLALDGIHAAEYKKGDMVVADSGLATTMLRNKCAIEWKNRPIKPPEPSDPSDPKNPDPSNP